MKATKKTKPAKPKRARPLDGTEFALALRLHRVRLGLTQAEVATLLDVSPRVYWQWEKGHGKALAVTMEGVIARLKFAKVKR